MRSRIITEQPQKVFFVDAFNISQTSPSTYPEAEVIRKALIKGSDSHGNKLFDADGMIRATAFIELAGTVDMAVALGGVGIGIGAWNICWVSS